MDRAKKGVYVWYKPHIDHNKNEYLGIYLASEDEHLPNDEKMQLIVSGKKLMELSHSQMSDVIISKLTQSDWNWEIADLDLFREEVHLLCENLF